MKNSLEKKITKVMKHGKIGFFAVKNVTTTVKDNLENVLTVEKSIRCANLAQIEENFVLKNALTRIREKTAKNIPHISKKVTKHI